MNDTDPKKMKPNPLRILFAGESAQATLLDGSRLDVWVRALPQMHMGEVVRAAEHQHHLVELCCYLRTEDLPQEHTRENTQCPHIDPPAGYGAVPAGWAQNLEDESFDRIYELARRLNFSRAVTWGERQIAAKKAIAPLQRATIEQVAPLVEAVVASVLERFSSSTPKSPQSPDGAGENSSPSQSGGSGRSPREPHGCAN